MSIEEVRGAGATRPYELADRFRLEDGTVFLSGVQAVARLAADQLRLDRRLGLTTAAFASGYQEFSQRRFPRFLVVQSIPLAVDGECSARCHWRPPPAIRLRNRSIHPSRTRSGWQ